MPISNYIPSGDYTNNSMIVPTTTTAIIPGYPYGGGATNTYGYIGGGGGTGSFITNQTFTNSFNIEESFLREISKWLPIHNKVGEIINPKRAGKNFCLDTKNTLINYQFLITDNFLILNKFHEIRMLKVLSCKDKKILILFNSIFI